MGRKYTFVGLVQSAAAGNAPRFINYNNRVYMFSKDDGCFIDILSPVWTLTDALPENVYSMTEDWLFEAVDHIELNKHEKKMLESFIRLNDQKKVKHITRYKAFNFQESYESWFVDMGIPTIVGLCITFDDDSTECFMVDIKYFANMELDHEYTEMELNLFEEDFDE